ncbi:hypothetical protein NEIMUCOT_06683 [Neisseria mucosa ATCC 25996]|uniref:Uncharacterized protein n=1 Tax=Neisseria mucosa (strain ATCC 25996 / DSM 4631 / NCTC 10774 / M26) TaxID=546266 RepID=D3A189_NEIM2|nr:hypothetical protein NEIMUCOT_06683 [Neisseria mucosa ATCC 25996]
MAFVNDDNRTRPAAFGRLCVETDSLGFDFAALSQPPSGGCVLKPLKVVSRKP